ncbi:MAG: hypothetical protein ACAF41_12610 [Leptolyngbya sp. BL-A-14]
MCKLQYTVQRKRDRVFSRQRLAVSHQPLKQSGSKALERITACLVQ